MPDDSYYWFGSYWQMIVMVGFLATIWIKKDCKGISLRSQFLYALVYTIRQQDLAMGRMWAEEAFFKIIFLAVTYGTVLSMFMYFRKTYEKKMDNTRIGIWIAGSLVLGMTCDNYRYGFFGILAATSVFLEAVAMIPQFQMIITSKRIDRPVILYLVGMAIYAMLYLIYMSQAGGPLEFRIAAAAIQFLLYLDFFRQIYPLIIAQDFSDFKGCNCIAFRRLYTLLCHDISEDTDRAKPEKEQFIKEKLSDDVVSMPPTYTEVHNEKELPAAGDGVGK